MIGILFEVDDEDENETLIACLPAMLVGAQLRVQIWTNVKSYCTNQNPSNKCITQSVLVPFGLHLCQEAEK